MSYSSEVLSDTPNAFFKLDEASGNFTDSSTNAFTGTPHGSITYQVATGFSSAANSVTFGSGGYISVPDNNALDASAAFTFECVINLPSTPGAFQYIASKGFDGSSGGYGFYIDTDRTFHINNTGVGGVWSSGYALPADSTFRHLACTLTGSSLTLYINGTSVATGSPGSTPVANNSEWEIGAGNDGGVGGHKLTNSSLAVVAWYPTALSPARVTAHYNALSSVPALRALSVSPAFRN